MNDILDIFKPTMSQKPSREWPQSARDIVKEIGRKYCGDNLFPQNKGDYPKLIEEVLQNQEIIRIRGITTTPEMAKHALYFLGFHSGRYLHGRRRKKEPQQQGYYLVIRNNGVDTCSYRLRNKEEAEAISAHMNKRVYTNV